MPSSTASCIDPSKVPIFLLKTKSSPHDGYEEYFSAPHRAFTPHFVPVLEHKYHEANLEHVKELFTHGDINRRYGGLIFTSQRAVEGFAGVLREVGESNTAQASSHLTLYTVGPATYRALNSLRSTYLPHAQILGEDAGTGEQLAHLILSHYNNNNNNSGGSGNIEADADLESRTQDSGDSKTNTKTKLPLLFLIGEKHRDVIPKTLMSPSLPATERIQVDELVVYETGVMSSFESSFSQLVQEHREREDQDQCGFWTVVFSPTGCEAMLRTLGLLPSSSSSLGENSGTGDINAAAAATGRRDKRERDCYIATIGPTTRDHLREKYGVEPDVCAEKPSPDGVGKGIEMFMEGLRR